MLPVLLFVSLMVFSVMHVLPGDPAALMLGGESGASTEVIAQLREQLGLNDPLYVQYGRFIWDALHGYLGRSTRLKGEVTNIILRQFPFTVQLSASSVSI